MVSESPRLKAIHSRVDADAFWKKMAAAGTPLIESIPGESDERLVTFVWRGTPETRSVDLVSNWEIENRFLAPRESGISRSGSTGERGRNTGSRRLCRRLRA